MNRSHLTAITRNKPSTPMRFLYLHGLLKGECLDYGCGKGFDADYFKLDKYDPHYFPELPRHSYDTIVCNYVLNVVVKQEQNCIINNVKHLLKKGGKAYFAVRRDVKGEHITSKGTYQREVKLELESIFKSSGCEIYKFDRI